MKDRELDGALFNRINKMYCLRFTGSNLVIHKMNEGKLSNVTKEELEKLIFEEKLSYEEIGRRYSVSGYAIVKRAKKLGIELPKKRKINSSETFRKGVSKKERLSVRIVEKSLLLRKLLMDSIVVISVNKSINLEKNMRII